MTRKILLIGLLFFSKITVFAGGLLTNTNQSAHFLRNPSRDASTEIDAAYTNPAGLTLMPEGFAFSFTNQSAFQTRTITSTFEPFAAFGGSSTKVYEGKASAPIIPSFQGMYKKGKWVLSGNIAVSGGGGKATFNKGLPSFESGVAMIPYLVKEKLPLVDKYSIESYMRGSSFIYGAQLGGGYEINKMLSAYAGFRLNIVNNGYEGYLRNVKINPQGGDAMYPFQGFNNMELDVSQSGWGVSPILGLNFNLKNLNIGAKYEFRTPLNVENKEKTNTTGMPQFDDGVNTPHDIPGLFTIGAAYKLFPKFTLSVGYHHFFDSSAKMAEIVDPNTKQLVGKQKFISGGVNEYLGGVEYQINDMFLLSSGFQITRTGVKDEFQSDLSFSLNSYSIGLGGAVKVSQKVRINIGYFWTNYNDWTKNSSIYNANPLGKPGTDIFSRTNKVFGAGVDFSF